MIGAVLKETPTIVTPSGVAGLQFVDEANAINAAVAQLKRQGIRTIVVTIHQGLRQAPTYEGPTDPDIQGLSGPIVDIVKRLHDEVDVVISGHAHGFIERAGRQQQRQADSPDAGVLREHGVRRHRPVDQPQVARRRREVCGNRHDLGRSGPGPDARHGSGNDRRRRR